MKAAKAAEPRGAKAIPDPKAADKAGAGKAAPAKTTAAKTAAAKTKAATPARTATPTKASAPAKTTGAKSPAKTTVKTTPPAKAATPVKATRPPKPPADKFLAEQQELLMAERATYTEQAEALRAEADALAQDMEPGDVQFDDESGEGATMNVDRERDLALSAQARAAVEEIDVALGKIDNGTYGVCERCGTAIPRPRLKALPHARLCVACKSGGLSRR